LAIASKARSDCVQEEQLLEAVNMMFRENDLKLDNPNDLKH